MFRRHKQGAYQLKADKGRLITCRLCSAKRSWKEDVVRRINDKFEIVRLTKWEVVKEFFKK